jgi:hypothetical protein
MHDIGFSPVETLIGVGRFVEAPQAKVRSISAEDRWALFRAAYQDHAEGYGSYAGGIRQSAPPDLNWRAFSGLGLGLLTAARGRFRFRLSRLCRGAYTELAAQPVGGIDNLRPARG